MARLDANANNASRLRRNAQRHADTITSAVVVDPPLQNNGTSIGFASQSANVILAGPSSGGAAVPTFRALVTADLPAGTGTVTSFSAGNLSPLFTTNVATATTTPALTFAITNQNANIVYAGPASGAAAAPTFRSLVALDIPSGGGSPLTTKGDIYAFSSVNARFPISGTNGSVLVEDSAQTFGFGWKSSPLFVDITNTRVGINDTAPSAKLTVKGVGTSTGELTRFNDSAGTLKFVFLDNGKLGLGLTPTSNASLLQIFGQTTTGIRSEVASNTGSLLNQFLFTKSRGTLASPSAVGSSDAIFQINANGYDGAASQTAASIRVSVDGTVSSGHVPGRISFSVASDSVSSTERVRIAPTGEILITEGNVLAIVEDTGSGAGTSGLATLVAGTVTVNTTRITADSRIQLTINGGTFLALGFPYVSARTPGTSFDISSTNPLDDSDVAWLIVEKA